MSEKEPVVEYRVPVPLSRDAVFQDLLRRLARARGVRKVTIRAAVVEALDLFVEHHRATSDG